MQQPPATSDPSRAAQPVIGGGIDWQALEGMPRTDDAARCYRVLVTDLVGLLPGVADEPDPTAFAAHVAARGARFLGADSPPDAGAPGIVFQYLPHLSRPSELIAAAGAGEFDAVIAAATFVSAECLFAEGGVRIGAGTANMASRSWTDEGAPLMNTPGFNSRATAQMVFKALLRVRPDLPFAELHARVAKRDFDTGAHLQHYPTSKLEGQTFAVLGFGNIGREVALLAQAFGMRVKVYARPGWQRWIEAEGFEYCASVAAAADGADVLSPHLGLGAASAEGFANAHIVDATVLAALAEGAMLINFDRGELVDAEALAAALANGRLGHAAIDADLFTGTSTAEPVTGPMAAYLRHLNTAALSERVLLLPHAAADTDHASRVAGAKQAADQIIAAIRYRCIANAVGAVPRGYTDLGRVSVAGVGCVGIDTLERLGEDRPTLDRLRSQLAEVDGWLAQLQAKGEATNNQDGVLALNQLTTAVRQLGLLGPGKEL